MKNLVFGLDIGGTGIKGGIVDVKKGRMYSERIKVRTPQPSNPEDVAAAGYEVISRSGWKGPVGVGFPAIIKDNVCHTATNIDKSWIGVDVGEILSDRFRMPTQVINDADAAAICEGKFGVAKNVKGLVMIITVGTGIGCGLLYNGQLIPNCELGVTYMKNGKMVEKYSSNAARKSNSLDWQSYGKRLNTALEHFDRLLSPNLIVLGGGISKNFNLYKKELNTRIRVKPAKFQNEAGAIGAAFSFTY